MATGFLFFSHGLMLSHIGVKRREVIDLQSIGVLAFLELERKVGKRLGR
jgi:hypothetical protein